MNTITLDLSSIVSFARMILFDVAFVFEKRAGLLLFTLELCIVYRGSLLKY